jgi:hypothetical protein
MLKEHAETPMAGHNHGRRHSRQSQPCQPFELWKAELLIVGNIVEDDDSTAAR